MNKKTSFVKGVLILGFILGLQLDNHAAIYVAKFSADGTNAHTLRGAISAAASNPDQSDTIILVRDSYQVTAQVYGDELAVTGGNLTIVGQGRSRVTISAAYLLRVFHVFPGAQLTLKNLVISSGGDYHYGSSIGGAILNEGTLKLVNCDILNSSAANGAGIYNSGILTLSDSVIANNSCFPEYGGSGGGIFNVGTLTAKNCVISNNFSGAGQDGNFTYGGGLIITPIGSAIGLPGGAGGNGGGIYNGGAMSLNHCSVMDNFAGNGGYGSPNGPFGALANNGGTGGKGGGIFNAGSLMLKRCVIGGNSCGNGGSGSASLSIVSVGVGGDGGDGGAGGSGGGMFNTGNSSVQSYNSLVAFNEFGAGGNGGAGYPGYPGYATPGANGNAGADGLGSDLLGDFTSTGYNLVREGDGSAGFTKGVSHDIVGTIAVPANPLLFKFRR